LAAHLGATHATIAEAMQLGVRTLDKYYSEELARAQITIDVAVTSVFLTKCLGGTGTPGDEFDWKRADVAALIHFTRTRLGWTEPQRPDRSPGGPPVLRALLRLPPPQDEPDAAA
jgi:hypothetical protein